MEEKIKEIISGFIKMPADQIGHHTMINQTAVKNSIMLHRMYAQLANAGIVVSNYADIDNFGKLVERVNGNHVDVPVRTSLPQQEYVHAANNATASPVAIGIDIEEIAAMPRVHDFRDDAFYTMNFSPGEIAYCILQQNPFASFAGLFAAKEAIVKADNRYRSQPFHLIHIDHTPGNKPFHEAFQLSITHTDSVAIAVAVQVNPEMIYAPKNISAPSASANTGFSFGAAVALIAIVLSLVAIIYVFTH